MGCGLQDISEGHENHYCHECANVSFLGFKDDYSSCKTCLDIGNCKFESESGIERNKKDDA